MQRSSEQDAGMATKTGLRGGGEGREMSLNNIKSPQPSETGSKLLHAQTNIEIEFSQHLSSVIKSYFTQLLQIQDHMTASWARSGEIRF